MLGRLRLFSVVIVEPRTLIPIEVLVRAESGLTHDEVRDELARRIDEANRN